MSKKNEEYLQTEQNQAKEWPRNTSHRNGNELCFG